MVDPPVRLFGASPRRAVAAGSSMPAPAPQMPTVGRRKPTSGLLGAPATYAREAESGDLRLTIFPLPTRPLNELTVKERRNAIDATYGGRLQSAIDLYRAALSEDGWQSGLLRTISEGIFGLPISFQGDPGMCSALADQDGTIGDYSVMHDDAECGLIFEDGIATNHGLGQFVFDEDDLERPIGQRRVPKLKWRDPRWLYRNPLTLQWYYTGNGGQVPIYPGDGEWFLYQPYPDVDSWRHGPWIYMTLAAIFARDAVFDRQRVSEVTTPTPVMRAVKPTTRQARKDLHTEISKLAHDNRIVLPEQWVYEIVSAKADYVAVCKEIVEWATNMVEVGLTGNLMGMKAQAAFTDASIYKRTTTDRRRFYAKTWLKAIREQGLKWWGRDNFGTSNVPKCSYDVESPEDKLAASKAIEQEGASLLSIKNGLDAHGLELDPAWLIERMQRNGIRVRAKQDSAPALAPQIEAPGAPAPMQRKARRK